MTDLSIRPSQLALFLRRLLPEKLAPLLVGPPGIGKTDIVRQVAAELGYRCICSHPATSDPTDYRGLPIVVDGKAEFSRFGQLRALIDADEPTVWFIDDLGQAPTSVQAALMQLIHPDGRRLNEVRLSPEVRIVAATNRPKDGAGVRGLLTPVLSRFHSILSIVPDLDSWCQWAFTAGVDPLIPGFLLYTRNEGSIRPAEEGSLFYTPHPPMEMRAFPCPRTWAHAGQILKAMPADASDGELMPLLAGAIGHAATAAFLSFRATHRDLPDLADIVAEPDAAPLPSDPAITYLTLTAICRQLDRGTAEPFVKYVRRLPREMTALFLTVLPDDKKVYAPVTELVADAAPALA